MERDKLGREIRGKWDGTDSWEESHKLKMETDEEYKETKERGNGMWKNIISHMDGLWHSPLGPDGCTKCTMYEDILYEAFERIDSLSGRTLTDLATLHRDDLLLGDETTKLALSKAKLDAADWKAKAIKLKRDLAEVIDSRREYMSAQSEHDKVISAYKSKIKDLDDAYFDLRVEHGVEKKKLQEEIQSLNQKIFSLAVKQVKKIKLDK